MCVEDKRVKVEQGGWERKERLRADGCPEDRVRVLIGSVCMDLCGPMENPSIESCG
jgi:hypothetical protein